MRRVDGAEKVTGRARYAAEHPLDGIAHAWIVGATIAKGRITGVDAGAARSLEGVVEVISHANAPRLGEPDDPELAVLQSPEVAYRGQPVALVVAETPEIAREAAALVEVSYEAAPHDVIFRPGHERAYTPEKVNPAYPAETDEGDVDTALAAAAVRVDATYTTPPFHNAPMEPHATTAEWVGNSVTLYDSSQGAAPASRSLAKALGLEPGQVRVLAPHVGGGFGSKGTPRPNAVLAALGAKVAGRPVKLNVPRHQTFDFTGYRTPTVQRVRLGAGADGRITAVDHQVEEQSSTLREFAEQTAVATRMMYAGKHRRTGHRLVRLDVGTPSWMRAPGEAPGMYALECAMDELATAVGMDPIELRVRNEPATDPEKGIPWSSRNLVACLREGAARFGWADRAPRREGPLAIGMGVAASTYPVFRRPSTATARRVDGRYVVEIAAADIGQGARTVLTELASRTLGAEAELVIGDSSLGPAALAGGSAGTASWGTAVVRACEGLLASGEDVFRADTAAEIKAQAELSRHAFGAQFAEVAVDTDTGEVRVRRLLGVFAAGRIISPATARSQFVGGMTMGLGMALTEETVRDPEFGDPLTRDLATYHVPVAADTAGIEAHWIEEDDPHLNPMGAKGIGEIGIVGTAAAIANAVFHATGARVRDLPLRPDRLLGELAHLQG